MTLFVSELLFNRKHYQQKKLHDVYQQHIEIYKLFENTRQQQGKSRNDHSGILWADKGSTSSARRFLILSDRLPVAASQENITSKPVPEHFLEYPSYRFTVSVNPVYRQSGSGKLLPLKGHENIADWFCRQAQQKWGFSVSRAHLLVDDIRVLRFNKTGQPEDNSTGDIKQPADITLQQATLSGYFTVTDRTCFQHSFTHGIGRGRGFGCGLLQITPVISSPFN